MAYGGSGQVSWLTGPLKGDSKMSDNIHVTKASGILSLVIDRQTKKNALTEAMYKALADQLVAAQTDNDVRVVLLRGAGEMFTAGNDVAEFAAVAAGGAPPQHVHRFLSILARADKPIVAAVQGKAIGVGTTMLLHCDLVVLAEGTLLTTPFVNLALVPEAASSLLLPALLGHARAFAMFALGEPLDAESALACGLANAVVPQAALVSTAESLAQRLSKQPIGALRITKRLMRSSTVIQQRMEEEGRLFGERLATAEAGEAFAAFAERRAPDFTKFG